jgi:hypothetical protein
MLMITNAALVNGGAAERRPDGLIGPGSAGQSGEIWVFAKRTHSIRAGSAGVPGGVMAVFTKRTQFRALPPEAARSSTGMKMLATDGHGCTWIEGIRKAF